jgi:acetolactate synthase I/II/III large subunit
MTGAEWLVRTLRERGVEVVFVLCGNGLKPFLDACVDSDLRVVDTRNEQSAAYMADAWGRMTGRLGVVATSAGPGFTNALTGLANAYWDGGPLLLISGCSAASNRGQGHFQELDQVAMAAPVCKRARFVARADNLVHEVETAIGAAVHGRPGPIHLTIPVDVWSQPLEGESGRKPMPAVVAPRAAGDPALLETAAEWMAAAERPFLVVGSGAFYAGAGEALREFARLTDVPVLSHLWDRGCVQAAWPQYVGVTNPELTGAYSLLAEADLVLTLGARWDFRLGMASGGPVRPEARIIRVDADANELALGRPADLEILADPRSALEQLAGAWQRRGGRGYTAWLKRAQTARDALLAKWEGLGRGDDFPLTSLRLCRELKPFLDRDVTFGLDGGNIGRWAHLLLWDRHPSHWFTCGASGVVGWGLPGAVALKMARPDHPMLLLSGDGSAGFTLTEIETALRFHTPYVAVVAHDGAWGIEADGRPEERRGGTTLGEIRFDRVAQALGARGVFIEHPAQLAPAIEEGLAADTATVIHVPTQLGGLAYCEREWGV